MRVPAERIGDGGANETGRIVGSDELHRRAGERTPRDAIANDAADGGAERAMGGVRRLRGGEPREQHEEECEPESHAIFAWQERMCEHIEEPESR